MEKALIPLLLVVSWLPVRRGSQQPQTLCSEALGASIVAEEHYKIHVLMTLLVSSGRARCAVLTASSSRMNDIKDRPITSDPELADRCTDAGTIAYCC